MKITKCDYCGMEISTKTATCPGCGEKIGLKLRGSNRLSGRIIFLLMAVYIIYSAVKLFLEK
jgi:hypothetical protein